jgi:hypothetical protein
MPAFVTLQISADQDALSGGKPLCGNDVQEMARVRSLTSCACSQRYTGPRRRPRQDDVGLLMKERIFGRKPEPRLEEFRGEHSKQAGPRSQPLPDQIGRLRQRAITERNGLIAITNTMSGISNNPNNARMSIKLGESSATNKAGTMQ